MLGFHPLGDVALGEIELGDAVVIGETGTFVLTGQDALWQRTGVAETGAFTLTGQPALFSLSMAAGVGAFTLAGQDAGLHKGFVLQAEPTVNTFAEHPLFSPLGALAFGESKANDQATTFVLTGANADGTRGVTFDAETGVFILTGIDALFDITGYPPNIRIFPRVGRGIRTFPTGRTISSTGPLAWNGQNLFWNGEQLVWNGQASAGGMIVRTSTGRGIRARAFGG